MLTVEAILGFSPWCDGKAGLAADRTGSNAIVSAWLRVPSGIGFIQLASPAALMYVRSHVLREEFRMERPS